MKLLLLTFMFFSGCAANPERPLADHARLGSLQWIEFKMSQSFTQFTIRVNFYEFDKTHVSLTDSGGNFSSDKFSNLANQLKSISIEGLPAEKIGVMRPVTDAGLVTIIWHFSKGEFKIIRDLRVKGRYENKFYKINSIFERLFDRLSEKK